MKFNAVRLPIKRVIPHRDKSLLSRYFNCPLSEYENQVLIIMFRLIWYVDESSEIQFSNSQFRIVKSDSTKASQTISMRNFVICKILNVRIRVRLLKDKKNLSAKNLKFQNFE